MFCCNWVARANQKAHRRAEEAEGTSFLSVDDVGMCGWKGRVQCAALLGPCGRAREAPANFLRPSRYREQYRPLNDSQDQLRLTDNQGVDRRSQLCGGSSEWWRQHWSEALFSQRKGRSERWAMREGSFCLGSREMKGKPIAAYRDLSRVGSSEELHTGELQPGEHTQPQESLPDR